MAEGVVPRHEQADEQRAASAVYSTPGGGQTLQDAGAIPGDDLAPRKARAKLALEAVERENRAKSAARYVPDPAE